MLPEEMNSYETSYKMMEFKIGWKLLCRILFCTWSLFAYIADVGSDINVAVKHHQNGNETYFYLTMLFVLLPAFIMSVASLRWYRLDGSPDHYKASSTQWIIRIIFLTFLMAPALRSGEALYYAWKTYKSESKVDKKIYARKMICETSDTSCLRLIEAFLESAPQLILQIYIIARMHCDGTNGISTTDMNQLISIATSLFNVPSVIVKYLSHLRESLDYKKELGEGVSIVPFLWRFFDLTARVLALGLFASVFLPYFFLLCGIHFCAMLFWIHFMNTDFCSNNKFADFADNMVLSFIYIFCFINPKDENTRKRYSFYCLIIFVENTVLISIWYHHCPFQYRLIVLIMVFVCFVLSIIIMVFYYVLLHPTRGTLFREPSPEERNLKFEPEIADQFSVNRELVDRTEREIGTSADMQTATEQNEKPTSEEMQTATEQNGKPKEINCLD